MTYRWAIALLLAICTTASGGHAVTLWMQAVPINDKTDGWVVTAVQATAAELRGQQYQYNGGMMLGTFITGVLGEGSRACLASRPAQCLNGKYVPYEITCTTQAQAAEKIQNLVGIGVVVPKGYRPITWYYTCDTGVTNGTGIAAYAISPNPSLILSDAPVSCTVANVAMTIRGRVGERAKASKNLDIQCASRTSLRLTLSNGGLVSVGGGEVQLLFGKNGKDVLEVTGTAPSHILKEN